MDRNSNKNWSLLICLVLILTTIAIFYQVCSFKFVNYDDHVYVYQNPNVQAGITPGAIKWAFTTGYMSNWQPITWISHMLVWQLFGLNAGGHHLINLIFHIANTLLLFIVLKQMTGAIWPSAFVAALFAFHPLHVESVAWVTERKDVLSTFFWFLTMWAYVRFVRKPRITHYLLVVVFFALGLMSKPMLVTLPFVLLLLDYWPLNRFITKSRKDGAKYSFVYLLIEKIPLFAMALASCIITFIVQQKGGAMRAVEKCSFSIRFANAFISYLQYIVKMIWPARLAVFYPHPGRNVSFFYAVISAVFLLAVTIIILRFAAKHRYLVTGWFWYLGTLVPVIGLVQVGDQAMADRYSYITLTGLFIIISWGFPEMLGKWRYKRIALILSALIVLSALAICAHLQQRYWKNTITLCEHALKVTDDNYVAHYSMTDMLLEEGRIEEAIQHNTEVLRTRPNCTAALNGLGFALHKAGRIDDAIGRYKRALEINPSFAAAHANLGYALAAKGEFAEAVKHCRIALATIDTIPIRNILSSALLKLGRFEEAVTEYRKILSAMPNDPNILNGLGYALAHSGKLAEAVKEYEKILNIAPQNAIAHNSLGTVFLQQGKSDEAVAEYRKSLEIKPDDPNVLYALGIVLSQQGKTDESIKYFAEAIRIKPDFAAAHDHIGYTMAIQGNLDEAAVHLTESLRLAPNSASAHYHFGQVLSRMGKIDEAITHFEKALQLEPGRLEAMNSLAWFLAASEKTTAHNPDKAVKLAQRACELTNYKNPGLLDTLAVAYAAAGDFSKAIETGENALELCRTPKQNTLKEEIENRLVLYKAGKPYIEAR